MYAVDLKIFTVVGIAGVWILNIDGLDAVLEQTYKLYVEAIFTTHRAGILAAQILFGLQGR